MFGFVHPFCPHTWLTGHSLSSSASSLLAPLSTRERDPLHQSNPHLLLWSYNLSPYTPSSQTDNFTRTRHSVASWPPSSTHWTRLRATIQRRTSGSSSETRRQVRNFTFYSTDRFVMNDVRPGNTPFTYSSMLPSWLPEASIELIASPTPFPPSLPPYEHRRPQGVRCNQVPRRTPGRVRGSA